ncbi:hypothetical protein D3C80_1005560 [compost metagenome]
MLILVDEILCCEVFLRALVSGIFHCLASQCFAIHTRIEEVQAIFRLCVGGPRYQGEQAIRLETGLLCLGCELFNSLTACQRFLVVAAGEKATVTVIDGELEPPIRSSSTNDGRHLLWLRIGHAVLQFEEVTFVVDAILCPEPLDDLDPLLRKRVATCVIQVTPQAHLSEIERVGARHQVQAYSTVGNLIHRRDHLGHDCRRENHHVHSPPDANGGRCFGQRRHRAQRFKRNIPMVRRAIVTAPVRLTEGKIETHLFGKERHLFCVLIRAW